MRDHKEALIRVIIDSDLKTFNNDEDFRTFAKEAFLYKMADLYNYNKTENSEHYINTQLAMDALMADVKKILE